MFWKHILTIFCILSCGSILIASEAHHISIELPFPYIDNLLPVDRLDVIKANGKQLEIVASPSDLEWLQDHGYPYTIIENNLRESFHQKIGGNRDLGAFHTYAEMLQELQDLQLFYPEICKLEDIGDTWDNINEISDRQMWAFKISDNVETDENEPEVYFDALHHAREIITLEVLLDLIHLLVEQYGSDPTVTQMVNEREIWFVPMVNPDGYSIVETMSPYDDPWWRKNKRDNNENGIFETGIDGVDLNRNYGYQWASGYDYSDWTYPGPEAFSEPETQAIRDFISAHDFVFVESFHSVAGMVLYPWGYENIATEDQSLLEAYGQQLALPGGYLFGRPGELLYNCNGTTTDWTYGEHGILSWTPEVAGSGFWPNESEIDNLVAENIPGCLLLIQNASFPNHIFPPHIGNVTIENNYAQFHVDNNSISYPNHFSYEAKAITGNITNSYTNACENSSDWQMDGFTITTTQAAEGNGCLFSGNYANSDNAAVLNVPLATQSGHIQFQCKYSIEENYDHAYFDVSEDGEQWQCFDVFTGNQNLWIEKSYSLMGFADTLFIRFRYVSDSWQNAGGFYVDNLQLLTGDSVIPLTVESLENDAFQITFPDSGQYHWAIRAFNDVDAAGPFSETISTQIDDVPSENALITPLQQPLNARCYPNPFNPQTTIEFFLPQAENVQLSIYNIKGQLVKNLVSEWQTAGVHSVVWDGSNAANQTVSSGLYFYHLQTSNHNLVQKMMLLK